MSYRKQISYLELRENGQRVKSAGYARLISLDKEYILTLHVNGLQGADGIPVQVYFRKENGDESVGETVAVRGEITCEKRLNRREKDDFPYGVKIPVDKNREIVGDFTRKLVSNLAIEKQGAEKHAEILLSTERSDMQEATSMENSEKTEEERNEIEKTERTASLRNPNHEDKNAAKSIKNETTVSEATALKNRNPYETEVNSQNSMDTAETTLHMMDTKWEQLNSIYPHIHPFRDEREFLSVGPEDFVVLRERYYQMTHNSFLLHGYYNYRHLLLMRQSMAEQVKYYIGVPGNFYEREKQVARMFGFESFEGAREPAWEGDFGYYMISVEL